jgi:hypothetical protein
LQESAALYMGKTAEVAIMGWRGPGTQRLEGSIVAPMIRRLFARLKARI